jgi:hypothetical protein
MPEKVNKEVSKSKAVAAKTIYEAFKIFYAVAGVAEIIIPSL